MSSSFEGRATVFRRRKAFLVPAAIGAVAIVASFAWQLGGLALLALLLPALALLYGGAVAFGRGLSPTARAARVGADDAGLWIDGRLTLPKAMLASATVDPDEPVVAVTTTAWTRGVNVRFADAAEAHAFVAALGLGVSSSAPTFPAVEGGLARLHYGMAASLPVALLVMMLLQHAAHASVLLAAFVPAWITAVRALFAAKLHVGAEGLSITRALRRPTFVAYDDVAAIAQERDDLVVGRHGGEELRVGFPDTRWVTGERRRATEKVLARIREACSAYAARAASERDEPATIARGGRSTRAWMAALRELGGGYREPVLEEGRLLRVVEDASADPSMRAGAAVALGPRLDDELRARVRDAAEACASPPLRAALRIASDDDDDVEALHAALEALAAAKAGGTTDSRATLRTETLRPRAAV